jgi:hypothetical protein
MSFEAARWPGSRSRVSLVCLLAILVAMLSPALARAATLVSDKDDYAPGEVATLTGEGFQPGEWVVLQVLHDDGTENTGENHGTWLVWADPEDGPNPGGFVTTWIVCSDDCVGSTLKATALGLSSGLEAWVVFTDDADGNCPGGETPDADCGSWNHGCEVGCNKSTTSVDCHIGKYEALDGTSCTDPNGDVCSLTGCVRTGAPNEGYHSTCEPTGFAPSTTVCRDAAGVCDMVEYCTGSSADCPADGKLGTSTVCRSAAGVCDAAEVCDGTNDACPGDSKLGTATTCRSAAGVCDAAEVCDGTNDACPGDSKLGTSTTCRPAAGVCDAAEVCDGTNDTCPGDSKLGTATTCRSAAGVCDTAETCDGTNANCPADTKLGTSTVCRTAAGVCDMAENCTGSSVDCPADAFVSSSTICRSSAGVCDMAENCTGSGPACPADMFKPSTTVCRPSAGECDMADNCSGSSAACSPDAKAECSVVTSSSLCPFDVDANASCDGVEDQFRLVFTPDVQSWPAYKISSSNPGQTYYNAVVKGTPNSVEDVEFTVPYPYVTVGGQALHVYDALPLTFTAGPNGACFVPAAAIQSEPVTIFLEDYQNGSGPYGGLTCVPPKDACDGADAGTDSDLKAGYCTFTVGVTIPASGQVYVNLHLDYGLTGPHVDACPDDGTADRYDKDGSNALENRDGADNGTGDLAIPNCQPYVFGHACPSATCAGTDMVSSLNEFKGIAGVIGQTMLGDEAVPGLKLQLMNGSTVLARGSTDADGFYLLNYKHKGKAANFTVDIVGLNMRQVVTLKANGYAEVDWDLLTGLSTVDYGSGWQPK